MKFQRIPSLLILAVCLAGSAGADEAPPSAGRWHLGVESVFGFSLSSSGGGGVLPGAGITFGKTPLESGFLFDLGTFVLIHDPIFPVYAHLGHQFSPHFRLWGIVGVAYVRKGGEIFDNNTLLLLTGVEVEWIPLTGETLELGLYAGIPFFYVILPLPPYLGPRLQIHFGSFSIQAILRIFPTSGGAALGSLGIQFQL